MTKCLRIDGAEIFGSGLVGEVKSKSALPNTELVREVEALMERYQINYMWFAWDKWAIEERLKGK